MKDKFIGKIGIWGQRHLYLSEKAQSCCNQHYVPEGTLEQYLTDFDRDTQQMYDQIIR